MTQNVNSIHWGRCEAVIHTTPENRTVGWSVEEKMWSLARRWPQRIGHVVTSEDVCKAASYISDSVWQAQLYTVTLWSTEITLNSNYIHIYIAEILKCGKTLVQKQRIYPFILFLYLPFKVLDVLYALKIILLE